MTLLSIKRKSVPLLSLLLLFSQALSLNRAQGRTVELHISGPTNNWGHARLAVPVAPSRRFGSGITTTSTSQVYPAALAIPAAQPPILSRQGVHTVRLPAPHHP